MSTDLRGLFLQSITSCRAERCSSERVRLGERPNNPTCSFRRYVSGFSVPLARDVRNADLRRPLCVAALPTCHVRRFTVPGHPGLTRRYPIVVITGYYHYNPKPAGLVSHFVRIGCYSRTHSLTGTPKTSLASLPIHSIITCVSGRKD